jgi:CO dehydrogenase nickel-insertion accessory protein CooC1
MAENLAEQLDKLTAEIEDITAVMDKLETFRSFNQWIQERHVESNIVCEINRYQELLSVDVEGTIIKADSLLQIRYVDDKKKIKNQ